jgi:hypothetical protein
MTVIFTPDTRRKINAVLKNMNKHTPKTKTDAGAREQAEKENKASWDAAQDKLKQDRKPAQPSSEAKARVTQADIDQSLAEKRKEETSYSDTEDRIEALISERDRLCKARNKTATDRDNYKAHAERLAEALRDMLADSRSLEVRHYAKAALAEWKKAQS